MTWESSPQRNTGAYGGRGRGSPQPNNGNGGGSSYGGGGGNGNYGSGSGGGGYGGGSNYGGGGSYGSGGPDRGSGGYDNRRNNQGDASQSQSRGAGQGEPPKGPHQWASSRRRYEWKDEYNDEGIAPRDEDLEKELFGEESHVHSGINFTKYESIKVHVKGEGPPPITSFEDADLHEVMKENIRLARYTVPTPVQKYSIPIITSGADLLACAQTGSGKTAAFLMPILSKLFDKARQLAAPRPKGGYEARRYAAQPLVLILAPTRELCSQIFDECRRFTYRSMLRPCAIYGGAEAMPQKVELEKGCDILAATPGRLGDFIGKGKISLERIKYLVLDEADRMLDMGFEDEIRKIVEKSGMPDSNKRQTQMFSATFPRTIRKLARDFLKEQHLFLKVGRVGGTTTDIVQKIIFIEEREKRERLTELLLSQPPSRTLIFVETKRGADTLDQFLYDNHFPSTSIHGDRNQEEREDALLAFKNGKCPILVATAVAARGLDVRNVMHVINFDLCNDIDEYVHRIGRTARVGNEGLATSFYNDKNAIIAPDLTKLLIECKQEIPDFLENYRTTELHFEEDDDDEDVPSPSYAATGRDRGGDRDRGGYSGGDRGGYGGGDRGGYGGSDRGGYGGGDRGSYGGGDRGSYGGGDRGNYGGGDRGGYGGGDRGAYGGGDRGGYGGDRGSYGGGDRGSYGGGDRGGYGGGDRDRGGYNGGDRDRGGYNGGDRNRGGYNGGDRDRGGYNGGDRDRGGYNGGDRDRGGYNGGDRDRGGGYNNGSDRDRGGGYNNGSDRDRGGGYNNGGDRDRGGYNGGDRGGHNGGNRGGSHSSYDNSNAAGANWVDNIAVPWEKPATSTDEKAGDGWGALEDKKEENIGWTGQPKTEDPSPRNNNSWNGGSASNDAGRRNNENRSRSPNDQRTDSSQRGGGSDDNRGRSPGDRRDNSDSASGGNADAGWSGGGGGGSAAPTQDDSWGGAPVPQPKEWNPTATPW